MTRAGHTIPTTAGPQKGSAVGTNVEKSAATFGIVAACIAATSFTLNDVGIKFLSGEYPLHQVVMIRAMVAMAITLAFIMPFEGGMRNLWTKRLGTHIIRGLLVVVANMLFFLGLAAIPLSEATAIFFISPLVITAFSVIFLGERVGIYRWAAVAAGLAGAIIMLRPGFGVFGDESSISGGFQWAALFPLAAAFCYAGLHTMTRKIGVSESASTLAFYIQLTFIVVSGIIGLTIGDGRFSGTGDPSIDFLTRAWIWPQTADMLVIAGIGLSSAIGGYFISAAYRATQAAIIAPFEYLGLVLAIIWGMVFFAEFPDAVAWTGIALVLGSGLFVFWREAVLNRKVATARPMPRSR